MRDPARAAALQPPAASSHAAVERTTEDPAYGPASVWIAAALLLTGAGTAILGPLLPHLSLRLHLTDAAAGKLLAAKFVGAFLGGVTTRRVRFGIAAGGVLGAVGFAALGLANGIAGAAAALAISGYGVGQMITACNILAGRRYTAHTGSALTLLNFFWSVGALLCGGAIALLLPAMGLTRLMFAFAALLVGVVIAGELQKTGQAEAGPQGGAATAQQEQLQPSQLRPSQLQQSQDVSAQPAIAQPGTASRGLSRRLFVLFLVVLFLYGGLETCLSDWITTYARRYGGAHQLLDGQSAVILLWTAIAFGRLFASGVLQQVRERTVAIVSIGGAAVLSGALLLTHTAAQISGATLLLGVFLAAYFPTMFAVLMRWQARPQQAGAILSVSGLGAAGFLWLTGAVSTHTGSLRAGMLVPLLLACALVVVTAFIPVPRAGRPQAPTA